MRNQRVMGFDLIFASFFFIATTQTCLGAQNTSSCNEAERIGLLKFKQSIFHDAGMLSTWVGDDCCKWDGVRCDASTGSVISLCLKGQNIWNNYYFPESNPADEDSSDINNYYRRVGEDRYLIGDELNSSLAELRNLKYLDLSGNDFSKSPIPEFVGSLKRLTYLDLSNAGFHGIIPPHIGNLSKLEVLDLSSPNQDLRADDMAWVFRLSLLKHLNLNGVDLMRAQNVHMVLYMIPSLVELSLSHCSLNNARLGVGVGPHLNLSIPNIQYLDLSKNFFSDQLPPFLQNMTSLSFLDISNSDLSLPLNLANFLNLIPSLSDLHLSRCELSQENLSPTNLNLTINYNIRHLDLSWNSIEGRFPSVLANLSSITVLDLHHNFLKFSIPVMPNLLKLDISSNKFKNIEHVGIWRQCHLKQLSVSRNLFGEEMISESTNTSQCSHYGLEELYLDGTQLNGSVTESLIKLTNLRVLDLSSNGLINIIPESLGRLRMLEVLDLSSNQLNGTIPISIGQLSNLKFLNLSSNNLQGTVFESHFANLSMLTYLDISLNRNLILNVSREWKPPFQLTIVQLSSCKITNEFPEWLRTQRNLKKLVLSNTSISGPLPTWFQQMPIIPHLDLSQNNLTGPLTNLPHSFGFQDVHRGSLLLLNNLFEGSIPKSLCTRTGLEILDLSNNRLTGKIPTCIGNLHRLRAMILSNNTLSGFIPSSIGANSLLSWLHLNGNHFSGELPPDIANLRHLWVLDVGNNEFSGNLPEWISELAELMVLRLYKNNFTGRIPPSLCQNTCLQILDVAHNHLKGPIPPCLGELSGMIDRKSCRHYLYSKENMIQVWTGAERLFSESLLLMVNMDLSSNELIGTIPEELTRLTELITLNLSHNHLTGNIPENMGELENLESLDFSVNNLSGMIPTSMAQLTDLMVLNFSQNNLSGQIPTGPQFDTFDPSSYAGNEDLCGHPLGKICPEPVKVTTTTNNNKYEKVLSYLDVMCGFATGFLGVIGVLLSKKQWRNKFYSFAERIMDNIYVAVAIKVNKIKRRGEAI